MRNPMTFVIKVGTSTLTHEGGSLNLRRVREIVDVLADIRNMGHKTVLVTSGSIAVGVNRLGLCERPSDLPGKQATAAVGQCELMNIYARLFAEYGYTVAQILLTLDVIEHETRKKNAVNTFARLLEMGVLPIVNENDSISTYEIEHLNSFGENDTLAAVVARLAKADRLVLLSDIDGLYDADPRTDPNAKLIPVVHKIDGDLEKAAGGAGTTLGSGGMLTKLTAAIIAMQGKIPMNIINGNKPSLLYDILAGKNPGTEFLCD